ncbi:peptidase M14 [Flavobacterium cyanobacteriorum]|uniref:Peptidase M14 n=1 Tax=Flavobacterium cyanobacteriorum TaxID=2022802 RepID=A0A255Z5S3_9FLAO|nr:M14 family zinc carboxypeptidase [Flavobacterium cyanobacteriorum]OYQ36782.1 peptidase M14 [Flavobacterium cyanobacteriorum]
MDFDKLHLQYREQSLYGRYLPLGSIEPLLKKFSPFFTVSIAGSSVEGRPVYQIITGEGPARVYIWSQMHGNESTTTKAIFDFLNLLASSNPAARYLKQNFTFCILPMVNPDGAGYYTRENAGQADLNRDSVTLLQPESQILRKVFDDFQPHFCYNMHDQRSIYGVANTGRPATVSFLAPSYNEERDMNSNRKLAAGIISHMNRALQLFIPGQVGRFDDGFNINCIGDMFQALGVPTILFEAGHFQDDYIREKTRKFIFIALLSGFKAISENVIVDDDCIEYFEIPQNKICFYDIIYKNVKINYENKQIITSFASHYKEELIENSVIFNSYISEIGALEDFYGHMVYDCSGDEFTSFDGSKVPIIEQKADFIIGLNKKFVNGVEKK